MSDPKSLFEYIAEEIDKALPPGCGVTGAEIYMRGFERFERAAFEKKFAENKRALVRQAPLFKDVVRW